MNDNAKDQINNMLSKTRQMAEYFRTSRVEKRSVVYIYRGALEND